LKKLKNTLIYLAVKSGLFLYMHVGFLFSGVLAFILSELTWLTARREKHQALENLCRFLTDGNEETALRIARSMCRHLARSLFECLDLWRGSAVLDNVDFAPGSLEALESALSEGKGCVMLTGHIGNWELMAAKYVASGFQTATFVKKSYDTRLDRLVASFRQRYGIVSIDRDAPDAGKQTLELLKKGFLLGALIDQDTKVASLSLPFFGETARTPSGPAALALKAGAALVCGSIARIGDRHQISITCLEYEQTTDRTALTADITLRANNELEQAIRRHPEQWVWFHRRWR